MVCSGVFRFRELIIVRYIWVGRERKISEGDKIMAGVENGYEVAQASFPGADQSVEVSQLTSPGSDGKGIVPKSDPMGDQLASSGLNKLLEQMRLDPQTRSGIDSLMGKLGNPMQDPFTLAKELYGMDPNSSVYKGFVDVMKKAGIEVTKGHAEDGAMIFKLKDGTRFSIGTTGGYTVARPGENIFVRTQEQTNKANELDRKMILQDVRVPLRNALRTESISR